MSKTDSKNIKKISIVHVVQSDNGDNIAKKDKNVKISIDETFAENIKVNNSSNETISDDKPESISITNKSSKQQY